jgi:hypothetical protein
MVGLGRVAERRMKPQARKNIMANTYTSLHYHIVFSTKNRERWLSPLIVTMGGGFCGEKDFPGQMFWWRDEGVV